MKIVIDIDEDVFTRLFDNGTEDYAIVNDDLFAIAKSIRNCTPFPENATNGDMIKAMFPNIAIVNVFGGDIWFKVDNSFFLQCSESWWDSPYKAEGSDEA